MDFKRMIDERNRSGFIDLCDIRVTEAREGYAKTQVTIAPMHINPFGIGHGGLTFTLADITAGTAANSYGNKAATLDSTINFFKPAKLGDVLTGEATMLNSGRTVKVVDVTITNQDGVLVAKGTFTYYDLGLPLFDDEK
ncbi:PaaI family thioesterase [Peptoniphilus equinus]|uniref:PaaI family thioesterase n=1 Tax=Peptoniphilus equinus TaxID=3016343 RepID=A0ABY7QU61_9FIRM|nr:PaaI family thioesterase [Peptoniphilus equinus]WBW49815.1 PaaI family thioesterase [Peptoniphilus equinus]